MEEIGEDEGRKRKKKKENVLKDEALCSIVWPG